jgi:hypothetical protein
MHSSRVFNHGIANTDAMTHTYTHITPASYWLSPGGAFEYGIRAVALAAPPPPACMQIKSSITYLDFRRGVEENERN